MNQNTNVVSIETEENKRVLYTYGANGTRTAKTINGLTTKFYFNGDKILGQETNDEIRTTMLFEYKGEKVNGFKCTYFLMLESSEPLLVEQRFIYKKNTRGDVLAIIDEEGIQICRYKYDDMGKCTIFVKSDNGYVDITKKDCNVDRDYKKIALCNPFRLKSYYMDVETGLYYINGNFYDPDKDNICDI